MQQYEDLDYNTEQAIDMIYNKFFKYSHEVYLDVFLCGKGKSNDKEPSLRDKIREHFKSDPYIRIFYPEDLFMDVFNRSKQYDMLSIEKFLADNSDIICIVCEDSAGALVELGAFTNNEKTFPKTLALINIRHKKEKSFIMLGPIKYIEKENRDNVLFYTSDVNSTLTNLEKNLKTRHRKRGYVPHKSINTIVGLYYFILMILYYFTFLSIKMLKDYVYYVMINNKIETNDFDLLFSASMKLLFKEKLIEKINRNEMNMYALTEKGLIKFKNKFVRNKYYSKTKLSDYIRLNIMKTQHCLHHPS